MIILRVQNNDDTNNVGFICPTNMYTSNKFENNKRTIIIIKQDEYYEPIIIYYDNSKVLDIKATISKFDTDASSKHLGIQNIFKIFKNISNKCSPTNSIPGHYKMKKNLGLKELLIEINKYNDKIEKKDSSSTLSIPALVMNYSGKIVGIIL